MDTFIQLVPVFMYVPTPYVRVLLLVALVALAPPCALGQLGPLDPYEDPYGGDPYRFWKWPSQDVSALVDGLASERLLYAAGVGGLLFVLARHDREVTEEFRDLAPPGSGLAIRVVEEVGNVSAVRPVAAVLFVGSLFTDDRRFQDAAFTSLESVIVANLITNSLKLVFGRARPWQGQGPMVFEPFSGNTSFPSGHAATAFAFVTPWLLYYPNAITPGLILLSTGTAFSRVMTEFHWLSDVVAGSAIGFTTAYWLTRRHQQQSARVQLAPSLDGGQPGLRLQIRLDP